MREVETVKVIERVAGGRTVRGTATGTAQRIQLKELLGYIKPTKVWVTNRSNANELMVEFDNGTILDVPPYTIIDIPMQCDWVEVSGDGAFNVTAFKE